MKVQIYTFGCPVNQAETQRIERDLAARGDELVKHGDADAVIINSCAVTSVAENSAAGLIGRIRKQRPEALIALIGCYGESLLRRGRASGADILLGCAKEEVVNLLHERRTDFAGEADDFSAPARAYVMAQSGCDNLCAYCIVPILRGRSASSPIARIEEEISSLAQRGSVEIVLSGINLALYRDGNLGLADLLRQVNAIEGLPRFRLSSLEPAAFTPELIALLPKLTKLCPHLHISLQSGCDRILGMMGREYTFEQYVAILADIRGRMPGISISTDIIVGFPGETEAEFELSIKNILRCAFSDIHIFKYSPRPGTRAEAMPSQVTAHKKSARENLLRGIKRQARYQFLCAMIGGKEQICITGERGGGLWEGITANNVPVVLWADARPPALCGAAIDAVGADGSSLAASMLHTTPR